MSTFEIAERLHAIAGELASITEQLRANHKGRYLTLNARAQLALDVLRDRVARTGKPVSTTEWAMDLFENHGIARSAAFEWPRRLKLRGHVTVNTAGECTVKGLDLTSA